VKCLLSTWRTYFTYMQPMKVLSANRIRLPDTFTEKFNIKEGDIVLVDEVKGCLMVIPSEVKPSKEKKK